MPVRKQKKLLILIVLLLTLTGLYFSYVLLESHFPGQDKNWLAQSFCGARNSSFSCEKVNESALGNIFGIPTALWGLSFFLFSALLQINTLFSKAKLFRHLLVLLFWTLLFGSIFDLFLLLYSAVFVQSICPLCAVTYLSVWISFFLIYIYVRSDKQESLSLFRAVTRLFSAKNMEYSNMNSISRLGVTLIMTLAVFIFLFSHVSSDQGDPDKQKLEKAIAQIMEKYKQEDRHSLNLPDYPWHGEPEAAVEIVEFSDFMCPYCSRVAPLLKQVINENRGKVKLKFVNLPLDINCNEGMSRQLHPGACELAKATYCANEQNLFWEMHDTIFNNHPHRIDREGAIQMGLSLEKMDGKKFRQCMESQRSENAIKKEIAEADRLKLRGTPTIFINGRRYRAAPHPLLFKRIIEWELNNR